MSIAIILSSIIMFKLEVPQEFITLRWVNHPYLTRLAQSLNLLGEERLRSIQNSLFFDTKRTNILKFI